MLDITTTIQEYIYFLKSRNACDPSIPYLEKLISPECQTIADITAVIDKGGSSYSPGWAAWTLQNHGDQMTPALQLTFIRRIISPMRAFQLYRDCGWLSDEADIELLKIFEGKLPEAEKQLANKMQRRAKDG